MTNAMKMRAALKETFDKLRTSGTGLSAQQELDVAAGVAKLLSVAEIPPREGMKHFGEWHFEDCGFWLDHGAICTMSCPQMRKEG